MANTYTQLHIQFVFAVQNRASLIEPFWKEHLYRYLTGIVTKQSHKLLAVNGMPDPVHLLVGMRPVQSVSDLAQDLKGDSSKWLNAQGWVRGKFRWQEGFGAFSYGKSQVEAVVRYIQNQETHHRKRTFLKEYQAFLDHFGVEHEDRYLFKPLEE